MEDIDHGKPEGDKIKVTGNVSKKLLENGKWRDNV